MFYAYSAGCGRTGTLIAIDYVWNLLKANLVSEQLNVLQILIDMRKQRQSLVQTKVGVHNASSHQVGLLGLETNTKLSPMFFDPACNGAPNGRTQCSQANIV